MKPNSLTTFLIWPNIVDTYHNSTRLTGLDNARFCHKDQYGRGTDNPSYMQTHPDRIQLRKKKYINRFRKCIAAPKLNDDKCNEKS